MKMAFNSLNKRLEFLNRLITEGFNVRMHGYEYFIRRNKFICVILINPSKNEADFYKILWNHQESIISIKKIMKILLEMNPGMRLEIH
ncbi:MAG: hypothetical protein QW589_03905 [Candidatus Bathyarchaeia archaeon]